MVVRGPHEIPAAIRSLLKQGTLARFRANAAAIHNQAVYEIPGFLRRIVENPATAAVESPKSLSEQRA